MKPEEISHWAETVRSQSNGQFMINLWVPDPPPRLSNTRTGPLVS